MFAFPISIFRMFYCIVKPNCSIPPESWVRYLVGSVTFVSPFTDSRRAVVNYWQRYMHLVLVNCLGGLSLPRNSVVRVTDCPNMIIPVAIYH